ncbi:MAG: SET domain-containing protein-lysine N-methyltransferase [Candidatus Paceibacterota bacterium]|jgi:SET domain-containing protein
MDNTIIKKSGINKKGVFANRNFKKGEIVLDWNPKSLDKEEVKKLKSAYRHYLYQDEKGKFFLMRSPEKYVNHSCDANTKTGDKCDIAVRDIKKGEEITSDYYKEGSFVTFKCNCGSKNCRGIINEIKIY